MILSRIAADGILKRLGLSRSGRVIEVRSRSPLASADDGLPGDFAEARITGGIRTFVLAVAPVLGLICLSSPLILGERHGVLRWLVAGMGIVFLAGFIQMLWDGKAPRARVDAEGITGYPSHRAVRRVFVPWSHVLTCEIRTTYNTFGEPIGIVPIFRGHNGETLMELFLLDTPMAEQDRIVKFIKSRLPDPQVDPWEV